MAHKRAHAETGSAARRLKASMVTWQMLCLMFVLALVLALGWLQHRARMCVRHWAFVVFTAAVLTTAAWTVEQLHSV